MPLWKFSTQKSDVQTLFSLDAGVKTAHTRIMDRDTKVNPSMPKWKLKEYYTITENDIGKRTFYLHGLKYFVDVIGEVLPCDIGKRIYIRNGITQVENKEQFEKRIAAEMHDNAEREAIMSGRSFSQAYTDIPGMWTQVNW